MDDPKDPQIDQEHGERVERRWAWISIVGWLVFLIATGFVLDRYRDLVLLMIALWTITGIFFAILPGIYLVQGPRAPEELLSTEQRTLQQLERLTEEVHRIADAVDRLEKRAGGSLERS